MSDGMTYVGLAIGVYCLWIYLIRPIIESFSKDR